MLVAAVTSRKARDRFVRTDDLKDALRPSQAAWWPPIHDGRTQCHALSAPVSNPTGAQAQGGPRSMLSTLHNHAVVAVVDKLEVMCSSSRTSNWRSHPSCMVDGAQSMHDGPSPQKGRRCSPSSVWAASRATLAFPICGFDLFVIVNVPMTNTTSHTRRRSTSSYKRSAPLAARCRLRGSS